MSLLILNQMAAAIEKQNELQRQVDGLRADVAELQRVVTLLNTRRPPGRPRNEPVQNLQA